MHIEGASRSGSTIYATMVMDNASAPQLPFRTPFTFKLEAGQNLPTLGQSIEGDLIIDWYNAADQATKDIWNRDPDQPLPPIVGEPEDIRQYADYRRNQIEGRGVLVAGMPVATDDRSKLMILGGRVEAMSNPDATINWKAADGQKVTLNATMIVAVSDAVLAWVKAVFDVYWDVIAGIDAGTITTKAQINQAFQVLD